MPWRGRKSCTWQQAERHCEGSVGFTIKDFKTKASLVKRRKGGRGEGREEWGGGGGGEIQDDTTSRLTLISGLVV